MGVVGWMCGIEEEDGVSGEELGGDWHWVIWSRCYSMAGCDGVGMCCGRAAVVE